MGFTIIKYLLTWSNSMHNLIFKKENNFLLIYNSRNIWILKCLVLCWWFWIRKKFMCLFYRGQSWPVLSIGFSVIFIRFPAFLNLNSWTDANLYAIFREQTTEKNFVLLRKLENGHKNLCTSNVGRIGGKQEIVLNKRCYDYGSILHEIFHSFGYPHENQRSDSKDYIKSQ